MRQLIFCLRLLAGLLLSLPGYPALAQAAQATHLPHPDSAREAQTRQQGVARRRPGEADSTFVRRVLPVAYQGYELAYAWRPSAFGKQLFFSEKDEEGNVSLLVLDPYEENTYAVRVLPLTSQGDITTLEALFFADANHDGRKDLLALSSCSLKEQTKQEGEWLFFHRTHYLTDTWQYLGPDKAGRPQYAQGPERPDLNELTTAAAVRRALAAPPRRPAAPKAARLAKATR